MVTVSGNPNPTYPTNPTTKYQCEFVNLFCIYAKNCISATLQSAVCDYLLVHVAMAMHQP